MTKIKMVFLKHRAVLVPPPGIMDRIRAVLRSIREVFRPSGIKRLKDAYEQVTFDTNDMLRSIRLARRELKILDHDARYLVIGRDVWHETVEQIEARYTMFNHDIPRVMGTTWKIDGLQVVVVPWMEGWCLLPEFPPQR